MLSLVFIGGCQSVDHIPSVDEMQGSSVDSRQYTLSDQYIEHRRQQKVLATTQGHKIAYIDAGDGPVIVMLHGVPSSSWLYRKMISSLQNDYRIIAIDLLGFGSSDKPKSTETNYLATSQAGYVEQVITHLGVKDYSLAFHDMGGLVAWEMLDNHLVGRANADIKNMIVLNTIVDKHGFNHPKLKKGVTTRIMSQSFSNQLSSSTALEMTFDNMGLTSNAELSESECNGYVIPMTEGNGDVLYDFYTSFDDARFARLKRQVSSLSTFKGAVLVLWGAEDTVLTTKQIPVLQKAANIDDANIHVFTDNAHFLQEEIPEVLNQHIREFLN